MESFSIRCIYNDTKNHIDVCDAARPFSMESIFHLHILCVICRTGKCSGINRATSRVEIEKKKKQSKIVKKIHWIGIETIMVWFLILPFFLFLSSEKSAERKLFITVCRSQEYRPRYSLHFSIFWHLYRNNILLIGAL